jgi:hypothetical protein
LLYDCPDFDKGMKTDRGCRVVICWGYDCPDFDKGMKTKEWAFSSVPCMRYDCPDFDKGMKTFRSIVFFLGFLYDCPDFDKGMKTALSYNALAIPNKLQNAI